MSIAMQPSAWTGWVSTQTPEHQARFSSWVSASVTMPAAGTYVPTSLSSTFENGKPRLSWPSSGHDTYYVFRRIAGSGVPFIPSQAGALANTTQLFYVDSSAIAGQKYEYQVFGYDSGGSPGNGGNGGSGSVSAKGDMTDRTSQSFSGAGLTSSYHIYAADLPDDELLGLVVQLHGDGAFEFNNPSSTYSFAGSNGMIRNARYRKAILLPVRAPQGTNNVWWTNGSANSNYLRALILHIQDEYNIDPARMWVTGFSGGAEQMSYWLLPNHTDLFEQGGGAVFVGGGGRNPSSTGDPFTQAFKDNFPCRWWVGADDRDGGGGWDTRTAVRNGYDWYTARNVNTGKHEAPGIDHYNLSGFFGQILGRYMDELEPAPHVGAWIYTRLSAHPTVANADLARWEGVVQRMPRISLRSTASASVTLGSGGYLEARDPNFFTGSVSIDTPVWNGGTVGWHLEAQMNAGGRVVYGGQARLPLAYNSPISGDGGASA